MSTKDTFLVTGGMGCIGAWTLYHLVKGGNTAVSFDLSNNKHRLNLLLSPEEQRAITFVEGDLTDYAQVEAVFQQHGINRVVHLAALQIPFCKVNPVMGAQVNVTGTANVFEAARQNNVPHLAYASSIAVYGPPQIYPPGLIAHDAPFDPHTLYGVCKVANEGMAKVYWQDYGVGSVALRPFTVYGVGRDQGMTSEPTKALLATAAGKPFHITFGGAMQFQWVSDIAQQFIAAAVEEPTGAHVFNLGNAPIAVSQFVETLRNIRPDADVTVGDTILPFPIGYDGSALRNHAKRMFETPLNEGITQTLSHFEQAINQRLLNP